MEKGNEPINPCIIKGRQGFADIPTIPSREVYGLTKREYFAGLAMQGLCTLDCFTSAEAIAKTSVRQADALLEALNKE